MKITVTKANGDIINIDLSDEDAPVAVPDGGTIGDEPDWSAPDAPGDSEWPDEDDDTDLEDFEEEPVDDVGEVE